MWCWCNSPKSGDGRLSASLSNDYVIDAARGARVVIAEINPDAPLTFGAEWPEDVPIHLRVPARRPPVELASPPIDDVSRLIAAHAASLIADGSTLQFGVGRIPDAILSSLSHARNLGIHSGLINDAVVDLIERGAVTNAEKEIDAGTTVTNQVIGTKRLYRFVHENKAVSVRPTSYTHGQNVLAWINRLVAMDSALQVGLDGSVNSETLNGVAIGAIGGQLDFVRGADAVARGQGDHRAAGDGVRRDQPHCRPCGDRDDAARRCRCHRDRMGRCRAAWLRTCRACAPHGRDRGARAPRCAVGTTSRRALKRRAI